MNENWFWKCPKCGRINCAKEDYEWEHSDDFNTECQNPECRYEVTAFVSHSHPEFEFYTEDGESVKALDEFDVLRMEGDKGRICPKCGKMMVLCEDERTFHEIWVCDGCGHKEAD